MSYSCQWWEQLQVCWDQYPFCCQCGKKLQGVFRICSPRRSSVLPTRAASNEDGSSPSRCALPPKSHLLLQPNEGIKGTSAVKGRYSCWGFIRTLKRNQMLRLLLRLAETMMGIPDVRGALLMWKRSPDVREFINNETFTIFRAMGNPLLRHVIPSHAWL